MTDEISGDHREYLALGGGGFMLGDGSLNYGFEQIFETYYTAHLFHGEEYSPQQICSTLRIQAITVIAVPY
ncbi:MAG: hypothetical protein ACRD2B_06455 [Terriglobia bacterium]